MTHETPFYQLIFNQGEALCWTTKPTGTNVYIVQQEAYLNSENYFCINPLALTDSEPTGAGRSRLRGRRADINVTSYRNIL